MAWFVKEWKNRGKMLDLLVQRASEAEAESAKEYAAAVCIQSWFRGCILRGYIVHLHSSASTIQKNYKGHLGREDYRRRLRQCLDNRRIGYYRRMATRIQSIWRGYYVRKYVFNYRAYKEYLEGVVLINEVMRHRTKEEWFKVQQDRVAREQQLQELRELDIARRHHYLLGTQVKQGIFKPDARRKSHPTEDKMRAIQFAPPPGERRTNTIRSTTLERPHSSSDKTYFLSDNLNSAGCRQYIVSQPTANQVLSDTPPGDQCSLPPLVKIPGPFKPPEEVRRLKAKPFNPTLRASSVYDSEMLSRMEMKAKEWRTRLIDEKFQPFSRMKYSTYQPSIFSGTSYRPHHTEQLRKTHPEKAISSKPFKTWIKPVVTFDEIDHTSYYH